MVVHVLRVPGPWSATDRTLKDKGSGNKDELIYDARGLLTEVKRWTNGSVTSSQTNLYDYAGSRAVKAPSSGAGTTIRSYSRYAEVGGGNLTKYYYFGGRMIASYTVPAPAHLQTGDRDPQLVVPPARIELPPQLLLPFAGGVLLLLVQPLGTRRHLGVRLSLARSASLSVVFLVASSPVVLVAGCGSDPVVRVYHVDHLGSTQVVTDWQGNIFRQIRYAAYGEIRGRFNSAGNPAPFSEDARFEFTGYETDFAGLDYAGARFFDPELAQFGSHDPAGQFPSPYAYGPGDPINFVDPTGAFVEAIVFAALAQIASAIDTFNETGSYSKASLAGLETAANQVTGGVYGAVKAHRAGESGRYMEAYGLNLATGGVYGTVQAFNNGQTASGVVGALQIAYTAYVTISGAVSGNEKLGDPLAPEGEDGPLLATNDGDTMSDVPTLEGQTLASAAQPPTGGSQLVAGNAGVARLALALAVKYGTKLVTKARQVAKEIHFDRKLNAEGRGTIGQIRYKSTPVLRLDYQSYPGTGGLPRLHGHVLPNNPWTGNIHIPLDPRRLTDPPTGNLP